MHFSQGAQWRPLYETTKHSLQIGTGCRHNACRFCTMYRQTDYHLSPSEEIDADIRELAQLESPPERIFLTGGNALGFPFAHVRSALEKLNTALPNLESVSCFGRIGDVARITDQELETLTRLGIDDISLGAESGYDPALAFMGKGHRARDIVEQCARLDAAGIRYSLFYLVGIAGAGKWQDNSHATARVFSQTHPKRVMVHTLTLFDGAPLQTDVDSGNFTPQSEKDILRELRLFCAELETNTDILGMHYGNVAPFNARLPEERKEVLAYLDDNISEWSERELRAFRRTIKTM